MDLKLSARLIRGEPVAYEEAIRGEFKQFRTGEPWGPPWSTTWFHVEGRVPDEWKGRRVVAVFDLGFSGPTGFTCEALAWKDGRPWRGVDPNHPWLPVDGDTVDLYLEAAANPRAAESGEEPAASMLALRVAPEPAFVLRRAELVPWSPAAEAGHVLDIGSHRITAVGHAHIDTAWEWPLREGKRKCARSWSTQLELMDAHPDYVFACSQPAQYAWMEESYPDLFARIERAVARGQWEPVGAMWVEADCNLPSGEALVRQLLHGKRYFMDRFGVETRILWLPDVFGYPGNLPQLIKLAGCDHFLTQKLSWNDTNPPEHHTFWWQGIDGTRVLTHFPPADTYNGDFSASELQFSARNYKDHERLDRSLYLFGYGDGGGGPTEEMIEASHRLGVPMGRAEDFFAGAARDARDLAVVEGELYFELHRGTYTSQARTKRLNRAAQRALREAEMWSVAAGDYPREELDRLWKTVLLNQFHDILPGSSIDWVYEDNVRDLEEVVAKAEAIALRAGAKHRERPAAGLESEHLRVELGDDGVVTSIWDKEAGREVLSGPGNVLELHDDMPRRWDAWDLDFEHRASFAVVGRRFGDSTVRQAVSVEGRVIRFDTEVDWHERHRILKVAFPVALDAREATYEVQFGHIKRPAHFDDARARAMFEVCAQRWADLCDGAYGAALLNDCKHGYDVHDGVMRLSLLRAPTHPDPNADQGVHRFTYALLPHSGDWREAGVLDAADDLNSRFGVPPSLISVDTPQVRVEAVKLAEDSDAAIVRLYEAWGRPCRARVTTTLPCERVALCDLLERELRPAGLELELRPFEIVTLKLEGNP